MRIPMTVPADSADEAAADGYRICIDVRADGTFGVEMMALEEEMPLAEGVAAMRAPVPAGEEDNTYTDIASALRAAARLYQRHPVGQGEATEQAAFAAASHMDEPVPPAPKYS